MQDRDYQVIENYVRRAIKCNYISIKIVLKKDYKLTEEQLHFTGTPEDSIRLSNENSNRYPVLAMEKDKLVTFLFYIKMME